MSHSQASETSPSIADLETELAVSRERLARNIDELAFRAQPKQIIKSQREQLMGSLKKKYASFMGTEQSESYEPYAERDIDVKADAKAKLDDLKAHAAATASDLKAAALAKVPGRDDDATADATDLTAPIVVDGGGPRVTVDRARLKLDELTHTEDGDLRTDRVATALAATGAVLVAIGAARRASA